VDVRDLLVDGTTVYAGTWEGVFASSDGGATWTGMSGGLAGVHVTSLISTGTELYAGTVSDGVWTRALAP
jgi:hypothetical protein